ncbi:MAG: macro domain-containing protein [Candidatus Nealsonbacteria bacterium]|nr:macro domain-containing protein [Candidatus Nealsonbacteria bacterium]
MHATALESTQIHQTVVRLIKDDITALEVDAFVFYAQPDLVLGTGFGTAISVRGGPTVQKELEELAPVAAGDAVVSAAGNLKAQHIVHAVGPKFQEDDIEGKLRATVLNSLKRAEEKGIRRIAMPAMGAGYYGIPADLCARVMLEAIASYLEGETGIKELILCVLDTPQYNAFQAALTAIR